jgi:hypothetical protein
MWTEVVKLHVEHTSVETAERRKRKVEDVQKRSEYRKAHGLEGSGGFGDWTAKKKGEELGPALEVEDTPIAATPRDPEAPAATHRDQHYVDWEGRRKPLKKWFGIW